MAGIIAAHAIVPPRPRRAAAHRLGPRRAHRVGRRGRDPSRAAGQAQPGGESARRGPGPARHGEPAFAFVPARHGGPRRIPRPSDRRLLDLARGDVPPRRAARARRHRGDRRASSTSRCSSTATPRSPSSTTCTTIATGKPYADPRGAGATASCAAASASGIALTLLPVLYAHGGFGHKPLSPAQRRFAGDPAGLMALARGARAAAFACSPMLRLGIAPHSARAVDALHAHGAGRTPRRASTRRCRSTCTSPSRRAKSPSASRPMASTPLAWIARPRRRSTRAGASSIRRTSRTLEARGASTAGRRARACAP